MYKSIKEFHSPILVPKQHRPREMISPDTIPQRLKPTEAEFRVALPF